MIGRINKSPQLEIFKIPLRHQIREDHELVRLSGQINWDRITSALSIHYSPDKGRRAIPVRKIAGLLILKALLGKTDESILTDWLGNPNIQYFCGEIYQQYLPPCNRSELVRFRKRIGEEGMSVIFSSEVKEMISLYKKEKETPVSRSKSAPHFLQLIRNFFAGNRPDNKRVKH